MHLRVQIPALNEAATIGWVVERCAEAATSLLAAHPSARLSILLIDDGSTDGTGEVAAAAGGDAPLLIVRHERPAGLGWGFREGVGLALEDGVDVLLHIDGDGQFDPMDMARLVGPVAAGEVDVALGSRRSGLRPVPEGPRVDRLGNAALAMVLSILCGRRFRDVTCGYRAFSRRALAAMSTSADYTYTHESILRAVRAGLTVREIAVPVRGRRPFGSSRLVRCRARYGFEAAKVIWRTVREPRA